MRLILAAAMATSMLASSAVAEDKAAPPPPPEAYRALIDCRGLTDPAERLACYDRQVARIEQAQVAGDLVVTDRASIREAKRGLFGFKLPGLNIFKNADGDDEEIESTITGVGSLQYGAWRLTLADGAVWEQTDSSQLALEPKRGSKIRIRKGALGSFRANIDRQPAIRVRRVQ